MNNFKRTYHVIGAFFLMALMVLPSLSLAQGIKTKAREAIVIDDSTGQVLFAKNAERRMPTSSMSKTMTVYAVFDALKKGTLEMEDTFIVSEKAWRKGGSKMFIEIDKQVKVEDLLRGVIIQSGNDATIALAEGLAGTEERFAKGITQKAKELGMMDTNFVNASGWPDPNHYSTASDLAKLASALIRNFPEYYPLFSETSFTYNNIRQENRNPLLYRNIGADGVKTGHTEVGGYGLIGSGTRNGRRVIMVINGLQTEKDRAQESAKLLDWGLKGFEHKRLFKKGGEVQKAVIIQGTESDVALVTDKDITLSVPVLAAQPVRAEVHLKEPLVAPVKAGDEIGKLIVEIPELPSYETPLFAGADVARQGMFARTFSKAKSLLSGSL